MYLIALLGLFFFMKKRSNRLGTFEQSCSFEIRSCLCLHTDIWTRAYTAQDCTLVCGMFLWDTCPVLLWQIAFVEMIF